MAKATIDLKGIEKYQNILNLLKTIISDDRIEEYIRREYAKKLKEI